ncbi:MAG: divergent polysaccharide deacetylase family protein [Sulfurimonas sp.]
MVKRKKRVSKNDSKTLTYIAWVLGLIALVLSALVVGYYLGYEGAQNEIAKKPKPERQKQQDLPKITDDSIKKNDALSDSTVNHRLIEVLKKDVNLTNYKEEINSEKIIKEEINSTKVKKDVPISVSSKEQGGAAHEYEDESIEIPPIPALKEVKKYTGGRPRLAIIIDDVSTPSEVNALNSLGIILTKSFLPPRNGRPDSAKLASHESQYMVHLPMEAQKFSAEEPFTLRVGDSQQDISHRIKELKELFPKVKYINNHTGSKFTSNEAAMNRLITALNENHINFIDSRTTSKSEAPKVMRSFGLNYQGRDVFLDHQMDKQTIILQIREAIKVAKKNGTAIAIGHPHPNTILALHESKGLFADVDLVTIDKLN